MKYNLIIGYQLLEKYLKFPTIRVKVDDTMIDEFEVDNENSSDITTIYNQNFVYDIDRAKHTVKRNINLTFSTPSKFKVYELDSEVLTDKGSLKIEVINNKSDYNNGFMKKRSMVLISPVYLLPKSLFYDKTVLERIMRKIELLKGIPGSMLPEITAENRTFWPGYCNHTDFDPVTCTFVDTLGKGGNYTTTLNIFKKHGIYLITHLKNTPKGFFWTQKFFYAFYQWYTKKKFYLNFKQVIQKPDTFNSRTDFTLGLVEFDDINSNNEDK